MGKSSLSGRLVLFCAFILYLLTLDSGLHPEELRGGDLITHQYAQVQARPSNAPGYPLYTMGGWLWFHGFRLLFKALGNPLPNPIQILSSYSTFWALLALWLFYRTGLALFSIGDREGTKISARGGGLNRHVQGKDGADDSHRFFIGLLTAFYALTYFFWFYATTTEQYASAIAQTLAIVYVYLRFFHRRQPGTYHVLLLAFLCGISLAHMLTVTFIVPPLILILFGQSPWIFRRLRLVFGAVMAALLPLISYSFIYVRGTSNPEWWGDGDWRTPNEWFWSFISTAQGRDELARSFESWCGPWAGNFPAGIWNELSLPIFLLGLLGIAFFERRLRFLFYGTLLIYLIFCWFYRCGNWFQVILPAYPLILFGLIPVVKKFHSWKWINSKSPSLAWLPHALLIMAVLWRFAASWPETDSRTRPGDVALDRAALMLNGALPFGVALFTTVDDALALNYLNQIWGIRPDLEIADHKDARRRIDHGQYVLASYDSVPQLLTEMRDEVTIGLWTYSPTWVALQDVNFTDEDSFGEPENSLDLEVVEGVTLVGYSLTKGPEQQPVTGSTLPYVDVILYWKLSDAAWPEGLSISIRPGYEGQFLALANVDVTAPPEAIIQQDQIYPMQGLYPVSNIPAQQTFPDAYRVHLPTDDAADEIVVLCYRATDSGFRNLFEIRLSLSQ